MFRRDDIVEAYSDEPRVLPLHIRRTYRFGLSAKTKKVPPLAFVQIPKTAGNSYVKLLRHNFERRMSINHESIFLHSSPEQFI